MKKNIVIILSLLCTFILTNEVNALTFNQTYKYQQLATTSNLPGMDHINGYRFAGSGAGVNNDVPCGMALYITSCYEDNGVDYCYYSNYNISDSQGISYGENHRREGVVYRDKLKEKVEAADATCDEDTSTAEYGWRYASNAGIIDTTFACLDKLYITSCRNNICNFSKILTKDYQEIKKSGSVNRDYLSEGRGIEETCLTKDEVEDNNTEEEKINCSNEPIKNLKGTQTFSVCYNNKYSDEDIKNMLSENNMVGCGKRYVYDETATRAAGNAQCDSKTCVKNFTVSCVKKNAKSTISISSDPGIADSTGYGTVSIKSSSSDGTINGYFLSEYYQAPTATSNWTSTSTEDFSIRITPGVKYLWVKDNNGVISDVITISVVDTMNNNNTVKSLSLVDGENNNLSYYGSNISFSDNKTNEYVRLSNKLDNMVADGFNPFVSEYKLEVDTPTITVYATLTSNDANFVPGYEPRTVNLSYGMNTILIKIKDKEGKERTYTILVTRKDDRNSDNTLNDIKLSTGKINFNANVTDYKIEIPENTTSVNVEATLNSDLSTYIEGYEPGTVTIAGNSTTKLIKVKSQTGSTRTYILMFVKKGTDIIEKESLQLSGISIPGVKIPFESNVSNYSLTVGYETDIIDIYTPLKDKNSTVELRLKRFSDSDYLTISNLGANLEVGENFLEIIVKDKDKNTSTYRFTIIRKEFGLDIEKDTTLKELKVLGHNINFNPNKKDYTVKIKTEKTLIITAIPNSNRAEVFIRGNDELTGFSTVRVKVVAENGDFETYSIDIKKDAYNKKIEIASIIAGAVIILLSSCIIVIKKKHKIKKEYYEE